MPWIIFGVVVFLICNLPNWVADHKYNNTDNKPNIGKMLEDKYSNNLSNAQVKNNIANGKYNRK